MQTNMEDSVDSSNSVFDLLTKLCQKFAKNASGKSSKSIKKLRAKSYGLLLSKQGVVEDVHDEFWCNRDPICELLEWKFKLMIEYNLLKHAEKLQLCIDKLEKSIYSNTVLRDMVFFLVQLKSVPNNDDTVTNRKIKSLMHLPTEQFRLQLLNEESFRLPDSLLCASSKYSDDSFYFDKTMRKKESRHRVCDCGILICQTSCKSIASIDNVESKETITTDSGSESIWEVASRTSFNEQKTWESYGYPYPDKESPFLTELENKSELYLDYYTCILATLSTGSSITKQWKYLTRDEFLRDIKYLLVGIDSKTFKSVPSGWFSLVPGVAIEGVSASSLKDYCEDLIFCGSCCKMLNAFVNVDGQQQDGYIFKELRKGVRRYLSYYRVAARLFKDSVTYCELLDHVKKLREQMEALASLCRVGRYRKSEEIPHGIALLIYLYRRVMSLSNDNVLNVLYSIFYSCCQVYFNRFLQQWVQDGNINDPYNEFFVKMNLKYLSTRGRTYWTRSFYTQEDLVPDFLSDIKTDILNCGKAMNLLKFCFPGSKLCLFLKSKQTSLVTCCITSEQLREMEHNIVAYHLKAAEKCKPVFSICEHIQKSRKKDAALFELIGKKKFATLKRLELERLRKLEEEAERKAWEMQQLKEQYDDALRKKEEETVRKIEKDIVAVEKDLDMHRLRNKLIREEAETLIQYYSELSDLSETRKQKIEEHTKQLRVILCSPKSEESRTTITTENPRTEIVTPTISTESFVTANEDITEIILDETSTEKSEDMHSAHSMDILNANLQDLELGAEPKEEPQFSDNYLAAQENFQAALRNRAKVMSHEMGIETSAVLKKKKTKHGLHDTTLTEAQKNKLRVMSSEFGIDIVNDSYRMRGSKSSMEINRDKAMASSDCFFTERTKEKWDNVNFVNRNVDERNEDSKGDGVNTTEKLAVGKGDTHSEYHNNIKNKQLLTEETQTSSETLILNTESNSASHLSLDLNTKTPPTSQSQTSLKPLNFDPDQPTPMSVDSTPLSDQRTPTVLKSLVLDVERAYLEGGCSQPTTAATNFTDEGFNFMDMDRRREYVPCFSRMSSYAVTPERTHSATVKKHGVAEGIATNCLQLFLRQSVTMSLSIQTKLVNAELLRYFIEDLQYLQHLANLRDYFFLQDGEFGRNITEGLFEKLYDVNFPTDLINFRTLQVLVHEALNSSSKLQENTGCLSFKINNLPSRFDLGDLNVLDCLSLSYRVVWPLNVLLPSDTVGKYDEVFKYLLKLHRVSWVQKKTFEDLKTLSKQVGKNSVYLMVSPQYRRIQQCRHVMTHFIQTLQNYIIGEVLHSNWSTFEKNLMQVKDLDQLYSAHTSYVKNILFMCLLNHKAAPIRKVLERIFIIMLKFYDYLRSRMWTIEDGHYVHPNFNKLEDIFKNFEEVVNYLFVAGKKIVQTGYQPHLVHLLDMINANGYYDSVAK